MTFVFFFLHCPVFGKSGWKNNIRTDRREIGCEGVHSVHVVQDREKMAGFCEHGTEHSDSIKGGELLE
jgi:hypothetical protein